MTIKILLGDDQDALGDESYFIKEKCASLTAKYQLEWDFEYAEKHFLKKLREKKYDMVITDLNWTPEDSSTEYKTGYRNLEACRELVPIRILRSTDVHKPGVQEKALYHGATDFISKIDYLPVELEKIIVKAIDDGVLKR